MKPTEPQPSVEPDRLTPHERSAVERAKALVKAELREICPTEAEMPGLSEEEVVRRIGAAITFGMVMSFAAEIMDRQVAQAMSWGDVALKTLAAGQTRTVGPYFVGRRVDGRLVFALNVDDLKLFMVQPWDEVVLPAPNPTASFSAN